MGMAFYVFAVLSVGPSESAERRPITPLIAPDRRPWSAINACDATQLAVVIHNFAAAFVVVIQLGIFPVAICGCAARFKIVAMRVHVLAGLRVRTARKSRGNAAASAAPQSAVVVNNVT